MASGSETSTPRQMCINLPGGVEAEDIIANLLTIDALEADQSHAPYCSESDSAGPSTPTARTFTDLPPPPPRTRRGVLQQRTDTENIPPPCRRTRSDSVAAILGKEQPLPSSYTTLKELIGASWPAPPEAIKAAILKSPDSALPEVGPIRQLRRSRTDPVKQVTPKSVLPPTTCLGSKRNLTDPIVRRKQSAQKISKASSRTRTASSRQSDLECAEVNIVLKDSHHTIWDCPDAAFVLCPAQIQVSRGDKGEIRKPNMSKVNIISHSRAIPFRARRPTAPAYTTKFSGHVVQDRSPTYATNAISVQHEWERVPFYNAWYLDFWIPIPVALFRKAETRIFNIQAVVSLQEMHAGLERHRTFKATEQMTMSHLHLRSL